MTGSTTPGVTDSLVGSGASERALSGVGRGLLGAVGATWVGAAAMAIGGTPPALVELADAMGPSAAWMVAAGSITLGLLGMLVLDNRAEQARRMRDLLARALEAFPFGVQIKDADLRYVWMNAAHSRRVGHPPEELIGKRPD